MNPWVAPRRCSSCCLIATLLLPYEMSEERPTCREIRADETYFHLDTAPYSSLTDSPFTTWSVEDIEVHIKKNLHVISAGATNSIAAGLAPLVAHTHISKKKRQVTVILCHREVCFRQIQETGNKTTITSSIMLITPATRYRDCRCTHRPSCREDRSQNASTGWHWKIKANRDAVWATEIPQPIPSIQYFIRLSTWKIRQYCKTAANLTTAVVIAQEMV